MTVGKKRLTLEGRRTLSFSRPTGARGGARREGHARGLLLVARDTVMRVCYDPHPQGAREVQPRMVGEASTSVRALRSTVYPGGPWTRVQRAREGFRCKVRRPAKEPYPLRPLPLESREVVGQQCGRRVTEGIPSASPVNVNVRVHEKRLGLGRSARSRSPPPARPGNTVLDRQVRSDGLVRPRGKENRLFFAQIVVHPLQTPE